MIKHDLNLAKLISEVSTTQTPKKDFTLPISKSDCLQVLAKAFTAILAERGRQLIQNHETGRIADEVAKWLTNPREKLNLILMGGVGCGKTTMMFAIKRMFNYCKDSSSVMFLEADAKEINTTYKNDPVQYGRMERCEVLGIDDLGTESVVIREYGDEVSPVSDLIAKRYKTNRTTIITTNLTPEMIRPRYGDRLADRMNETYKFLAFQCGSFRNF